MGVNQEARAGQAWAVLVDTAAKRETITYTALGSAIGVHHRHLNRPLGLIQDHCLEGRLPPLTILVHQKGGVHGAGFIAWDIQDLDEGFEKVFTFNWRALPNPFTYALNGGTEEDLTARLLRAPERSEEVYRQVVDRGIAQRVFRTALLQAYGECCAFCGLGFVDALEAAHIVRWRHASPAERMDVRNGLLLCATHHRLFDSGWMGVTDGYLIQHDPADEPYEQIEADLTRALHGKKLRMPGSHGHWPSPEMLRRRAAEDADEGTES